MCWCHFFVWVSSDICRVFGDHLVDLYDDAIIDHLHSAKNFSTQCASIIIFTILGVNSFVYILTPKMAHRLGAEKFTELCDTQKGARLFVDPQPRFGLHLVGMIAS